LLLSGYTGSVAGFIVENSATRALVRPQLFARREIVERASEHLGTELRRVPDVEEAEALAVVLLHGLHVEEVDDHRDSSTQPRIGPAMTLIFPSSG
jgi:hypothetical protein